MLNIGNRRECFFDDFLLNKEKTTAQIRLHHPEKRECVILHDAPWEGAACGYHHVFFDPRWHGVDGKYPNGTYRMYYYGCHTKEFPCHLSEEQMEDGFRICYAESGDGIHFEKPDLGICTYGGNTHNNLILDKTIHPESCQLYVFYDENPDCPENERYKGITAWDPPKVPGKVNVFRLYTMLSEDGIHFRFGEMITNKGGFDSLNIMMWDKEERIYRLYARGMRIQGMSAEESTKIGWDAIGGKMLDPSVKAYREIFYYESTDYKTWSAPVCLSYEDDDEYHMYTNGISRYFRAPHMYIGLPTRYCERKEWTENYDELCGKEKRLARHKVMPRFGLSITDCGFMTSRDGLHFHRFKPAFMRPGPENPNGWLYGDCYPTPIPMVTKSHIPDADDELSFYSPDGHCLGDPPRLYRYVLRMDGFASLHAEGEEETVVTKPFIYEGDTMYANLSTSAFGHLYFTLICDGEEAKTCEIFGDSTDKKIHFPEDAVKRFSGKEVVLKIQMFDADLYSIKFEKEEN